MGETRPEFCHGGGSPRQYLVWSLETVATGSGSSRSWWTTTCNCGPSCGSLAVDPDWVDDVAQEAFLTAYREWKSFDNSRDFGKWLRGIAANIVRNELRKDARRQRILHTELAELLLDRQRDDRSETEPISIDTVRDCLEKLTARNRELVRARYRDGDTAERLAERFELSAANVRQLLARCGSKSSSASNCGSPEWRSMNDPRFDDLLNRLLDDALAPGELDELARLVRDDPERRRLLQEHLQTAEWIAQSDDALRDGPRFVAATLARTEDDPFVAGVRSAIANDSAGSATGRGRSHSRRPSFWPLGSRCGAPRVIRSLRGSRPCRGRCNGRATADG